MNIIEFHLDARCRACRLMLSSFQLLPSTSTSNGRLDLSHGPPTCGFLEAKKGLWGFFCFGSPRT